MGCLRISSSFPSLHAPRNLVCLKIINMKRGNCIFHIAASIPLAHLPRPLTLQEYFSFNLSPRCHKHCLSNLFLSSSHKNYPPYFSKSWQISTFDHLLLRPWLSLSWLQTHEHLWRPMEGSPFLQADGKFQTAIAILIYLYAYPKSVEINLE